MVESPLSVGSSPAARQWGEDTPLLPLLVPRENPRQFWGSYGGRGRGSPLFACSLLSCKAQLWCTQLHLVLPWHSSLRASMHVNGKAAIPRRGDHPALSYCCRHGACLPGSTRMKREMCLKRLGPKQCVCACRTTARLPAAQSC